MSYEILGKSLNANVIQVYQCKEGQKCLGFLIIYSHDRFELNKACTVPLYFHTLSNFHWEV